MFGEWIAIGFFGLLGLLGLVMIIAFIGCLFTESTNDKWPF